MDANDPLIADDVQTDEERMENERRLKEMGLNPHELSREEAKQISDDMHGGPLGHEMEDDGENMSGVVTEVEADGND